MTSKDADTAYAFWTSPEGSFTVTYSLDLFHEIDLQVNDGYRRIPHGGIEVGGLLFGTKEDGGIRLQSLLPITCEHATGPSFTLSERDEQELRKQIGDSRSNPELSGMVPLGWFIAHTRTALRLTDREVEIFDRFFPQPGQLTVLVKPEKFQPTRFLFLVRQTDGSYWREGAENAIILPLPGRGNRPSEAPVPSIAAPDEKIAPEKIAPPTPPADTAVVQSSTESSEIAKRPPLPAAQIMPQLPLAQVSAPVDKPQVPKEDSPKPRFEPAQETAVSQRIPQLRSPRPETSPVPPGAQSESTTVLTTIPRDEYVAESVETPPGIPVYRKRKQQTDGYGLRLVLILVLAAMLGCIAGYWAYLQLPPAVIGLSAHVDAAGLVVSWPADQTRGAVYAAVRVNDGTQQPLSPEDCSAGSVRLKTPVGSNVKVELVVQHWMRDSRGILRYIGAPTAAGAPAQQ
jgi:hypothetical protein